MRAMSSSSELVTWASVRSTRSRNPGMPGSERRGDSVTPSRYGSLAPGSKRAVLLTRTGEPADHVRAYAGAQAGGGKPRARGTLGQQISPKEGREAQVVRTVHRPSSPGRGAGPGGSTAPQP